MPQFPIYITAVDKVTATIDRINKKLTEINAPTDRLRKTFAKLGEVSGMNKLGAAFNKVARYALDAFRSIGRIVAPLAAITGALSVGGMVELVRRWSQFGMQLGFAARRIGVSVGQLHGFEGAARLSGASARALDSGIKTLADSMTDAIGGRNAEALLYFNTLGINIRAAGNHARNVADVLPEVANKIAAIKDPILQARVATELFGGAGEELLPFLRRGAAGIAEYVAQAKRYGLMNEEGTAAAGRLWQAQERVSMAVDGFTNTLAQRLEPILTPLLTHMAEWISDNREWIATGIADKVKELADWLESINWAAVGQGIKDFVKGANDAAQAVGGWTRAAEILFGLWIGAKFISVMANIAKMAIALKAVSGFGGASAAGAGGGASAAGAGGGAGLGILGLGAAATYGSGYAAEAVEKFMLRQMGMRKPDEFAWHEGPAGIEMPFPMWRGGARAGAGANDSGRPAGFTGARASAGANDNRLRGAGNAAQRVMDYFQRAGWSREQAAGITANLQTESGFNPKSVGDGGKALGIAQWHPDRQANFARWAGHGLGHSTLDEQLAFVNYELTSGAEKRAGQALRAAKSANAAGAIVSRMYERPGDTAGEMSRRGGLADHIAKAPPIQLDTAALAGSSGAPGPNGKVNVTIRHANPPAGSSINANSSGDAINGAPKIERAMPDYQAA